MGSKEALWVLREYGSEGHHPDNQTHLLERTAWMRRGETCKVLTAQTFRQVHEYSPQRYCDEIEIDTLTRVMENLLTAHNIRTLNTTKEQTYTGKSVYAGEPQTFSCSDNWIKRPNARLYSTFGVAVTSASLSCMQNRLRIIGLVQNRIFFDVIRQSKEVLLRSDKIQETSFVFSFIGASSVEHIW